MAEGFPVGSSYAQGTCPKADVHGLPRGAEAEVTANA